MSKNNTFIWLLRRELWEYKGAMLWAPVIVATLMCVLLAAGLLVGGTLGGNLHVEVDGKTLADASTALSTARADQVAKGAVMAVSVTMISLSAIPVFVVFFYCLGALYDERRDRSVLFWKSLPVSDAATVLSKLTMAVVVAPLITLLVALAAALVVLVITGIAASMMGAANQVAQVAFSTTLLVAPLQLLALLPLSALWALPTVGWLLMVSAWARSRPFLWAVGIPVGSGVLMTWLDRVLGLHWDIKWYWLNVVLRGLGSSIPGTWLGDGPMDRNHTLADVLASSWAMASTPGMWVGVAAGAAMVAAAIRLRRWRDEG